MLLWINTSGEWVSEVLILGGKVSGLRRSQRFIPSEGQQLENLSSGRLPIGEVVLHCWVVGTVVAVGVREMVVVGV